MASRPSRKIGFRSATISRWGDLETLARVARVEASAWYRSRCAGRAISDRRPQLPLVLSGGKICGTAALKASVVNPDATPGNAVVDEVGLAAVQAVDGERRVSTSTRLPNARSPYAAISDADTLKAEVSAAPALLDDITDMGRRSAAEYVRLRRWRVEHLRSKADVFARSLDLCPEGYPVAGRAVLVCTLSSVRPCRSSSRFRNRAPPCCRAEHSLLGIPAARAFWLAPSCALARVVVASLPIVRDLSYVRSSGGGLRLSMHFSLYRGLRFFGSCTFLFPARYPFLVILKCDARVLPVRNTFTVP